MKVIDDEEYEKNKIFTIVLEEPVLLEVGQRHGEYSYSSHTQLEKGFLHYFKSNTFYFIFDLIS